MAGIYYYLKTKEKFKYCISCSPRSLNRILKKIKTPCGLHHKLRYWLTMKIIIFYHFVSLQVNFGVEKTLMYRKECTLLAISMVSGSGHCYWDLESEYETSVPLQTGLQCTSLTKHFLGVYTCITVSLLLPYNIRPRKTLFKR